jgi:hypothetical protein
MFQIATSASVFPLCLATQFSMSCMRKSGSKLESVHGLSTEFLFLDLVTFYKEPEDKITSFLLVQFCIKASRQSDFSLGQISVV